MDSVRRALNTLGKGDLLLLVLTRLEGLTVVETAEVLGIPPETAVRYIESAEANLCRSLTGEGAPPAEEGAL
jgi:DNA-directed RNA polymerase specialized sigma24 family protein